MAKILKSDRAGEIAELFKPLCQLELDLDADAPPLVREEERNELLAKFRANELDDLTIPIIATTEIDRPRPLPYTQRNKATANFTRFRLEEFSDFAVSFTDRPFLRDHSSKSVDNGGVILSSAADKKGRVHRIRQEIRLLKPWAMEDAIVGTMRSFSIGWGPKERGIRGFVESAYCTVCDAPMFGSDTDCTHWPGDVVKLGDSGKRFIVELEWRNVIGRETSEVTFPAAAGTGIEASLRALAELAEVTPPSSARAARPPKETEMDPELLAALGLPPDATIEQVRAAAAANTQLAQEAAIAKAEAEAASAKAKAEADARARAAHKAQVATLQRSAISAGKFTHGSEREKLFLELAETNLPAAEKLLATWEDSSVVPVGTNSDGSSALQSRQVPVAAAGMAKMPAGNPALQVEAGLDEREKWRTGAAAWIFQRSGLAQMIADSAKMRNTKEELDPVGFRGMTLADLARDCLERAGINTRGMYRTDVIGRALEYGNEVPWAQRESGGYNTTSDFAVLLENVMHKVLLGAYMTTPDTWSLWCTRGSVSDFRDHPRYRLGSFGKLSTKNEAGEFKQAQVPDGEKEKISAAPHGNIVGLSRESLVDDDMGAFSRIPVQLGRAAKLSVEIDAYDTLKLNGGLGPAMNDGKTMFHADHNNIGTGAAISIASIEADRQVLANQTDPSGNELLDMRPHVMVAPLDVGSQARVINEAKYDTDDISATTEQNKFMMPNKVLGLFQAIVDTARLTGNRRYMFVNPMIIPCMEVAFLDGRDEPYLETRNGWRFDGVQWKIVLDYGVGGVDFRGCVTNAGS